MSTRLLKRKLNPFLTVSLVIVISLLAGVSVVYQANLSEITDQRISLEEDLEEKNNSLTDLESNYETLTLNYEEKTNKTNELEDDVNSLENQVSDLQIDVSELDAANNTKFEEIEVLCSSENNITTGKTICEERGFE